MQLGKRRVKYACVYGIRPVRRVEPEWETLESSQLLHSQHAVNLIYLCPDFNQSRSKMASAPIRFAHIPYRHVHVCVAVREPLDTCTMSMT